MAELPVRGERLGRGGGSEERREREREREEERERERARGQRDRERSKYNPVTEHPQNLGGQPECLLAPGRMALSIDIRVGSSSPHEPLGARSLGPSGRGRTDQPSPPFACMESSGSQRGWSHHIM